MNNSQFRKLVLDTPARQADNSDGTVSPGAGSRRDGAPTSALGSRMRASIPMTPRSISTSGGIDFKRQLAERASANQPAKRFKSSAAPKGTKLAAGYTDRTKDRISDEDDDKAARVKALEEMLKLQQIDQATFEKLRDEIIGGDIDSVHLVKGLDFKLLERVRRGEDVLNTKGEIREEGDERDEDVEDEFDRLEDQAIAPVVKEKAVKKGEMAPPSLVPGQKRTRDQILAEMKAARQAAKEKAAPALGAKFKKFGASNNEPRIERDSKGREVLITVDEHGNEKRKVRKARPDDTASKGKGLLMPDKDAKPLGMEVPEIPKVEEEDDEDMDIFDGVGDDYDPLAGLDDEDDEDDEGESAHDRAAKSDTKVKSQEDADASSMPPPPRPKAPPGPRNYFGESKDATLLPDTSGPKALSDPTILAALKKAAAIRSVGDEESEEELARKAKLRKMLQSSDRDAEDMDIGFGSSRFDDAEELGDEKFKLSKWDAGAGYEDDGQGGGKSKRKRGPKKRKGDVNSAADVMKVLERRKGEAS